MSNVINFKEAQKPVVLACDYYMHYSTEDGASHSVKLTGEEYFTTSCPECGKEHRIDFYEFCSIMGNDGDLYGTMMYCAECSAKKNRRDI